MENRPSFSQVFGLARSLLIYYAIPGRARAWRRFYGQWIKPGDLCFDIGAHVGNRSAAMLALGARVIAVEPQPLFARILRRLFRRSDLIVVESAIGATPGRSQILISTNNPTMSTTSLAWLTEIRHRHGFEGTRWDQNVEVDVTTLDALIAKFGKPVFCKIDVEGSEADVLRGLSVTIRLISFEYLPAVAERTLACLNQLKEIGDYEFNIVDSEFPRFAFSTWMKQSEVEGYLRSLPPERRAGEVYARLAR